MFTKDNSIILAGTGHRPDKLGGYSQEVHLNLVNRIEEQLKVIKPDVVISGMALGFDTALAVAAISLKINLIAAIPFNGQDAIWNYKQRMTYHNILKYCIREVIVTPGSYSAYKMQRRNEWMIDNCNTVLTLFNGTSGGTANTIKYAKKQDLTIINMYNKDYDTYGNTR